METVQTDIALSPLSFKSYYVVWKHIIQKQRQQTLYGLNRTM